MTTHKLVRPQRTTRSFAVAGGIAAAALAIVASPAAGRASADDTATAADSSVPRSTAGDAVGRPAFDNPAPGIRLAQAVGDQVFNQNSLINQILDGSPLGASYHESFGTPDYSDPSKGENGSWQGFLNPGLGDGQINPYDLAQTVLPLPGESDTPGTVPSVVRGLSSSSNSSSQSSSCQLTTGGTTVSAQGSC